MARTERSKKRRRTFRDYRGSYTVCKVYRRGQSVSVSMGSGCSRRGAMKVRTIGRFNTPVAAKRWVCNAKALSRMYGRCPTR